MSIHFLLSLSIHSALSICHAENRKKNETQFAHIICKNGLISIGFITFNMYCIYIDFFGYNLINTAIILCEMQKINTIDSIDTPKFPLFGINWIIIFNISILHIQFI